MVKKNTHSIIIQSQIALLDFFVLFGALILSRYIIPGSFPQWYHLAISSLIWALLGIILGKYQFWNYGSRSRAIITITVVNILLYTASYFIWKLLFPDRGIHIAQFWALPIITAVECTLYLTWHQIFKKIPYLYVDTIEQPFHERGIDNARRYLSQSELNPDLTRIYQAVSLGADFRTFVTEHQSELSPHTLILHNPNQITKSLNPQTPKSTNQQINKSPNPQTPKSYNLIISLTPFNSFRHFNAFLETANSLLTPHGIIAIHGETSGMRRHRFRENYPAGIAHIIILSDYLWNRVFCKLTITRPLYMLFTRGTNRNFPRVEVLGRIAKAGFDITGDEIRNESLFIAAMKNREPDTRKPNYGIFVRLPRKGKNGKNIGVFKLRTMYAYSEYIQEYTYQINGLETGGKLRDDFRVNRLGSFCRSRFLDELPMLLNWLKGDLKLVGVRPLSAHYLSLYTPEMQRLHLSVKPGIFPPLYYEYPKPKDLPEIQASERRYITSYLRHPILTDWHYFWGMMKNIALRHSRSH